jgi:predicted ATPase/DNA-binding SARP family transcriptional activator
MSRLNLFLLGPPQVVADRTDLKITRRKALALLIYLVSVGERQSRDTLATLLWPELDQRQARASLRRHLSELHQALPGDWLQADQEYIELRPEADLWLDVTRFGQKVAQYRTHGHAPTEVCPSCLASLTEAVGLYRGDFLSGFTLPDCPDFDEWQFFQTESLRQELATALEYLIDLHAAAGDIGAAIPYARRWLALDPLHEPAHCRLMLLYAQIGQQAAALRQYQRCLEIFETELGSPPSAETTALYERIRTGDLSRSAKRQRAENREKVEDRSSTRLYPESSSLNKSASLPSVRSASPPLKRPAPHHNLPIQTTPFIGRDLEVTELTRLLAEPDRRLITLIGLGGIGKTRLAIEVATKLVETFEHGLYFVRLAPLDSPESIVPAIAEALNFSFYGEVEPEQQLLDYLREKVILLVLDNFEHLLDGTDLVTYLLAAAPALKILVTSREGLNLQEEWLYPLQGLRLPVGDLDEMRSTLEEYSAIKLFMQSARRVRPDFALVAEAEAVMHICHLVEGMPLGIELAAAWAKVLPCAKIAAEIEANLDFLSSSRRNVPARHRSMGAVFEQSWQRLSETERTVLAQLSVFQGGFRRRAAEQIAGASLTVLAGLVDKSLVSLGSGGRNQIHELLRQFSGDKLHEAPAEARATQDRHSDYFLRFLWEREAELTGKQQKAILDEIQAEVENVRMGWNWAIEREQVETLNRALDSLYHFYWVRCYFQEGEEVFRQAAERLKTSSLSPQSRIQDRLLARRGAFCTQLGRYGLAEELLQQSLGLARHWAAQAEIAFCLNFLGDVATAQGLLGEAKRYYQESLAFNQEISSQMEIASCLNRLGVVTQDLGDYIGAKQYYQDSLRLYKEIGHQDGMAHALDKLGTVTYMLGEYVETAQYYQESLAIFKEIGNQLGIAKAWGGLGMVAWLGDNNLAEAKVSFEESLAVCREIGHRLEVATRLFLLGSIANEMGMYEAAQRYCLEALAIAKELGIPDVMASSLGTLGEAACGLGDLQAARKYLHEALSIARDILGLPSILRILDMWAALLVKEEGLQAGGSSSKEGASSRQGVKEQALELLALILHHPASMQLSKDKAAHLLAELAAELPLTAVVAAREHGQVRALQEIVADLLTEPT